MKIAERIFRKIKNQPSYVLFSLVNMLFVCIYFPRYVYLFMRNKRIMAIDWSDGTYCDFYLPIVRKLDSQGFKIIYFFNFDNFYQFSWTIFRKGLPRVYGNYMDNKILISAQSSSYRKLNKTERVQIFHSFGSFGVLWGESYIKDFDILFLVTKFQREQLQVECKNIAQNRKIFNVGYPKIDSFIESDQPRKVSDSKITTFFYGPSYHREISSIFSFLPVIIDVCNRNNYRLIMNLHPFLYNKHNYDYSGGIDWFARIRDYEKKYKNIIFLEKKAGNHCNFFAETGVFLTDVSGIGFEFVLATKRPIIFLGSKLKIPLKDLRSGEIEKYKKYPEIYYRGRIGPVVEKPDELEKTIKSLFENDCYKVEREKFCEEYVFNLKVASDVAASELKKIYEGQF